MRERLALPVMVTVEVTEFGGGSVEASNTASTAGTVAVSIGVGGRGF